MSGAPSQLDLLDYKPILNQRNGEQLPDSVRGTQRLTGMSGNQSSIPLVGSPFKFSQHGQAGAWFSELLPHTASIADDLCVVNSMYTEAINHGPGVTFLQTGTQIAGRPSMGAWLSYGLGQDNANLPSFVVLITKDKGGQPLGSHLWGSGFLPTKHQGVQFRAAKDPVLYLGNPAGVSSDSRRMLLDRLKELHEHQFEKMPDTEIQSRIDHYEMAYSMQTSVPEATDISSEPKSVLDEYGPDVTKPGTFAANCLQARRLAERGVRFIQLYHQDWDHHGGLPGALPTICKETDQPAAALVKRFEAMWSAGGHAGCVGRRIWAHELLSGKDLSQLRPRPSSSLLQSLDGGWRSESRVGLQGNVASSVTTSQQTACTFTICTRPLCICWASTTNDSPTNSRAAATV